MSESPKKFRVPLLVLLLVGGGALLVTGLVGRRAPTYKATVSGTVTIDGILAESGTVTFHPGTGGQPAVGSIHSDGSYSLRSGQGDLTDPDGGTIAPGAYVVTIAINAPATDDEVLGDGGPPVPGPSLTAAMYRSKETSDLKHVVKPGPNVIVLNLDGAAADEATADEAPADEAEADEAAEPADGDAAESANPDSSASPAPSGEDSSAATTEDQETADTEGDDT